MYQSNGRRAAARSRWTTANIGLLILSASIGVAPLLALAQSTLPVQAQHAPNPVPERKPPNLFRGTSVTDWAAFREYCQQLADKNAFHPPLNRDETGAWRNCADPLDLTASHVYLPLPGKPQSSPAP